MIVPAAMVFTALTTLVWTSVDLSMKTAEQNRLAEMQQQERKIAEEKWVSILTRHLVRAHAKVSISEERGKERKK
jgi:hypothetical protein